MIYLDNGATSLPKPKSVERGMVWALNHLPSPGRGSSSGADAAAELLFSLRMEAAAQFRCQPEQVILTTSCTHGLNIAIKSLAGRGDRVVVSCMEHNAVMRPLYAIGADVHVAGRKLFDSQQLLEELERLLTPDTKLCVMTHVSNVFGWRLPIEEAADLCRERGIPFVLDAAQSAGCLDINMEKLGAAFIAMPGHKGLLGPQGTGGLYLREGLTLPPFKSGGSGVHSFDRHHPADMPTALEAGTLNGHGIAGLNAGLDYIQSTGVENIHNKEISLARRFLAGITDIPDLKIYGDMDAPLRAPIVSLNIGDMSSASVSDMLWEDYEICVRAGAHCAPLMHKTFGTEKQGAVRFSFSCFNTEDEIDRAIQALHEIAE